MLAAASAAIRSAFILSFFSPALSRHTMTQQVLDYCICFDNSTTFAMRRRRSCCWRVVEWWSDVRLHVAKLRRRWRLVPSSGPARRTPLRRLHLPRGTDGNNFIVFFKFCLASSRSITALSRRHTGRQNQLHDPPVRRTGVRLARVRRHQRMLPPLQFQYIFYFLLL